MTKSTLNVILFLFFSFNVLAQDTIVVQTLNFEDITKRRGWYEFPDQTNEYQKILMYYTLKCDFATTQDNFACGEWDYTTFTNLYQHDNIGSQRYLINGQYPDTIDFHLIPSVDHYQTVEETIVYDDVINEEIHTVGSGNVDVSSTFKTGNRNGRSAYLWKADELLSAGIVAGSIDKLGLDFNFLNAGIGHLKVRMKHSSLDELTVENYSDEGFETKRNTQIIPPTLNFSGLLDINLTTPFEWDGISNVIIEFCFRDQPDNFDGTSVKGGEVSFPSGVYADDDDDILDFDWGDYISIPSSVFNEIDSFITVSFWSYGDENELPANTTGFEGINEDGQRVINVHLPWSNSRIYWDAGNNGGGSYDRIDQEANNEDFYGKWNHWAFTKNVETGSMKIFLNGELWHSGLGNNRRMNGITNFSIAGRGNGTGVYNGKMNEFRIWNIDMDEATIHDWMYKDVDESHPNFGNLQAYYKFDDAGGSYFAEDMYSNSNDGSLIGLPSRRSKNGCVLDRNIVNTVQRPNLVFTQGEYESHIESIIVEQASVFLNAPSSIIIFDTELDLNNPGITQTAVDTFYVWEEGYSYTYNEAGIAVDSVFHESTYQFINDYKQHDFQLQNYVTPYGIGLNLGVDGFRWVYDVTDYGPLLHDLVEISAGNQQELIDLKFIMIEGTPPRDVLDLQSIWIGDYQHEDIANDVVMPAVDVDLMPEASSYRIKTRTSGHWFGGFQNCAEFCPKLHHIKVNGNMEFEWNNWKECADNPVIDQGGTWIYDRAGWCPGAFTDTYDHELTSLVTPGSSVSLDYGMQITPNGMEGNYRVTMQLVSYGENNFTNDVAISEILSPNDWEFLSKTNPICADAKIVIENTGSMPLTSAVITYNVAGGITEEYTWIGNLNFLEKAEVTLPISSQNFWITESENYVFEVNVASPNGMVDEYEGNNNANATFEMPEVYSGLFMFRIQTNNAAYENSYTIKDAMGNVVMSRDGMSNSTLYEDTVFMEDGCYVLEYLDSGHDGMNFFANNDGNGSVRFKSIPTNWQNNFNPNFGSFIKHQFIIDNTVGIDENNILSNIAIYPNPSNGMFNIRALGMEDGEVEITILNSLGAMVSKKKEYVKNGELITKLNLSDVPNGMYYIKIFTDKGFLIRSVVKSR